MTVLLMDDAALFAAMQQITEESDFLYILGQAAARAVREEFEQGKAIARLEGFYDEARGMGKSEIRSTKSETNPK